MTHVVPDADQLSSQSVDTVPILDDATATAIATDLGSRFLDAAAQRDRDRELPHQEVAALAATGLLAASVPAEFGGGDVSARAIAESVRVLATADPSVAEIAHNHFVYVNLLKVAAAPNQQAAFFGETLNGAVFASALSEAGPDDLVRSRLTRSGPGSFSLTGLKAASTGAPFATWFATLARLDDGTAEGGEELVAFVRRDAEGVTVTDHWDGMGLRTAASSQLSFDGVEVPAEHVLRRSKAFDGPRGYGAYAQLLHAAVEVGIARAALTDATEFVRTSARPHAEAYVRRAQDDPLLIQRFGELTVDVRGAEAALVVAASAVDDVLAVPSDDNAAEASLSVGTAMVLAEQAALVVATAIFEVGGPESVADPLNLHRHWRDARTHSLRDPIRWKYHHLGRYTLLGIRPPRHAQV